MKRTCAKSQLGFTLAEMMISLGLGILVLGCAVQIFSTALSSTWQVQQRAEMQQNVRAAESMLIKDISMAGSGLPQGGLALISGTSTSPAYGCDPTNLCTDINGTSIKFPTQTSGTVTTAYLYAITPGYGKGPIISAGQGATDVITVAYQDPNLPLSSYAVTFTAGSTTSAKFTGTATPALNDPGYGLKVGDLLWFSGSSGGSTIYAIGEVTGTSGTSSPFTVSLATTDNMKLNQTGGTSGLSALVSPSMATGITASRVLLISYFLNSNTDAAGNVTYRLMRQVNGQAPTPLVDNISDLRFRYDVYNSADTPPTQTNTTDALMSTGGSPNLIRKVNIAHLTIRSPLSGTQGYQGLDIQTSVAARNLSFSDRYPGPTINAH